MERQLPLCVLESTAGRLDMTWDELRLTLRAVLRWRETGIWKLTLVGERGRLLVGTLTPDGGGLQLYRTLSLSQLRQAGAWPMVGTELRLRCPWEGDRPFPMTGLFCFARPGEGEVEYVFDGEGYPVLS